MNNVVQPGNHFQADCDRTSLVMSFDPTSSRHRQAAGNQTDIFGQVEILDARTLERMAADPSTHPLLLERLAAHPIADVRVAVADNENAPLYSIWALAKDADPDVRYQIAENHCLPLDLICLLSNDENPYVASRAQQTFNRLQGH